LLLHAEAIGSSTTVVFARDESHPNLPFAARGPPAC